jgi:hypothetical protein
LRLLERHRRLVELEVVQGLDPGEKRLLRRGRPEVGNVMVPNCWAVEEGEAAVASTTTPTTIPTSLRIWDMAAPSGRGYTEIIR